jgi:hypothetical protein
VTKRINMENSNDEDEERRKREINMFAAFALGGEEPISGFDLGEYNQKKESVSPDTTPHSQYQPTNIPDDVASIAVTSSTTPIVSPLSKVTTSSQKPFRQRGEIGADFTQVMQDDITIWNQMATIPKTVQRLPKNIGEAWLRNDRKDNDLEFTKPPTSNKRICFFIECNRCW